MSFISSDVLNYKNPAVIRRFQKEFAVKANEADIIFSDLMKFFYASKTHELQKLNDPQNGDLDFIFIMDDEMKYIDHMWHIFLLYTEDYLDFCMKYFGEFLHHRPDIVPNNPDFAHGFEDNLTKFLSFNYDLLGEEAVTRWFSESANS